ncbi:MAG: hypothetical protein KBD60_00760 [Sterolibacterium sp.]|nr:hypothetical protein [Sterolibacterium sp.]
MKRIFLLLSVAGSLWLAACGFQLRGAYPLPFDSLYIALPETGEMYAQLKRAIMAGSAVQVISEQKAAQVTLQVLEDRQAKNILSLSAAGRAREYQLTRTLLIRLADGQGREWMAPSRIAVHRDITYNDDLVLSKESEEALLWRDMQNDLVQQVLRRLSAVRQSQPQSQPQPQPQLKDEASTVPAPAPDTPLPQPLSRKGQGEPIASLARLSR